MEIMSTWKSGIQDGRRREMEGIKGKTEQNHTHKKVQNNFHSNVKTMKEKGNGKEKQVAHLNNSLWFH